MPICRFRRRLGSVISLTGVISGVWTAGLHTIIASPTDADAPPPEKQMELTIPAGYGSGYIQYSSNLVDWIPWAAFSSCSTNLIHTISTAAAGSTSRVGFYRVLTAVLSIPDNYVYIPPGRFLIGSPPTEIDRGFDEDQHVATVHRGFWISRTEVTIRQWLEVMPRFPSSLFEGRHPDSAANYISWQDAMEFCRLLTLRDTATGRIPPGSGYRLPTETEWEYAARAGTDTRYSFGDDPNYQHLGQYGWYATNSAGHIHPVGQLPPNPWGLFDVHGNVFEWCLDPDTPYPGSTRILYHRKIYRGGSYYCPGRILRSADRSHNGNPDIRDSLNGLRLVIGYHPDSLRTVEVMSPPTTDLHWGADQTEASLTLRTASSGGTIQYRILSPNRGEPFTSYAAPLVFTDAATLETRVIKPAAVVSDPLVVVLERTPPPEFRAIDADFLILTTADPASRIQVRELPNGSWLDYPHGQLLIQSSGWAARCRHPDKLTSRTVQFDAPHSIRGADSPDD
jgi:formylglycine-generating enzyme required for sulfatase activity